MAASKKNGFLFGRQHYFSYLCAIIAKTMNKRIMTLALALGMSTGLALAQGQHAGNGEKKACCQQKGKAIVENILTRTSVRKFEARKVEPGKVDTLLRAAMAAPTAVNKQPWHFVVVDDPQVLSALADEGGRGDMLRNAPLAIVVCGDMGKALNGKAQEYWIQDCSAATENLLLAAHAMGLGAVWTGQWPMDNRYTRVQRTLGMPESIVPLCIVIVGYPAENPTPKDKWKPENVSYNKYQGAVSEAPDFKLNDLQGQPLSLSSLRGRYVVLDFWGSWCIWCIRGIPKMKEYYEKYNGKFEILGIDCNDPEDKWRAAVKEHALPWLHVYNPKESTLLADYGIQGFPTKIILSPEGQVAKTFLGEDPAFYDYLDELFGK